MWSNFCQLIKRRTFRGVLNKKDVSMSCCANQCGRGWRILRGGNVRDAKRIYLHLEERRHIAPHRFMHDLMMYPEVPTLQFLYFVTLLSLLITELQAFVLRWPCLYPRLCLHRAANHSSLVNFPLFPSSFSAWTCAGHAELWGARASSCMLGLMHSCFSQKALKRLN